MGKIVKKKKSNKLEKITSILCFLAVVAFLFDSLFVNTWITGYTIDIQSMNDKILSLKSDNLTLNMEIQNLQNKDRIYVIAKDAGLDQNQDNTISIASMEK